MTDTPTDTRPTSTTDPTADPSPGPCTRCGRVGETTTLTGAIVCRDCIAQANAEETTRELDQRDLEGFA